MLNVNQQNPANMHLILINKIQQQIPSNNQQNSVNSMPDINQ